MKDRAPRENPKRPELSLSVNNLADRAQRYLLNGQGNRVYQLDNGFVELECATNRVTRRTVTKISLHNATPADGGVYVTNQLEIHKMQGRTTHAKRFIPTVRDTMGDFFHLPFWNGKYVNNAERMKKQAKHTSGTPVDTDLSDFHQALSLLDSQLPNLREKAADDEKRKMQLVGQDIAGQFTSVGAQLLRLAEERNTAWFVSSNEYFQITRIPEGPMPDPQYFVLHSRQNGKKRVEKKYRISPSGKNKIESYTLGEKGNFTPCSVGEASHLLRIVEGLDTLDFIEDAEVRQRQLAEAKLHQVKRPKWVKPVISTATAGALAVTIVGLSHLSTGESPVRAGTVIEKQIEISDKNIVYDVTVRNCFPARNHTVCQEDTIVTSEQLYNDAKKGTYFNFVRITNSK